MNSLEDTFFHHSFVVGAIEEPRDQSRCLVPGSSKTKEAGSPSRGQLLCCEWQSWFAARAEERHGEGAREAKTGNRQGEELGAYRSRHSKETVEVRKEGNEKRGFHGRGWGGGEYEALPLQGLNRVPLKGRKTKPQPSTESLWSDSVGTRNPPPGLTVFWEKFSKCLVTFFFLNVLNFIEVQWMHSVVLISAAQGDSEYIYICLFALFSTVVYHRVLNTGPCHLPSLYMSLS